MSIMLVNTIGSEFWGSVLLLGLTLCLNGSPEKEGRMDQINSTETKSEMRVIPDSVNAILKKHQCLACHHEKERLVGPSFQQIARKGYSASAMLELIRNPKPSNWPGYPAMPPIQTIAERDVELVEQWINSLEP